MKDVEDLIKASGVTADSASLDVMMSRLEGKSLQELIKEGSKSLPAMPAGGAAAATGGGAAAGGGATPEEKKKEAETEEDVDMGDLFGGGEDDY